MLLEFRDNIETDRQQQAADLGLSQTELAFYDILIYELGSEGTVSDSTESKVKEVVQSLVQMLEEATEIVDFFSKWNEVTRVKRNIKHKIIENFDESLVAPVTERFMELAETKFK
jgi:type I restriction enzyme R subunit